MRMAVEFLACRPQKGLSMRMAIGLTLDGDEGVAERVVFGAASIFFASQTKTRAKWSPIFGDYSVRYFLP
jgi:hypothetical protein